MASTDFGEEQTKTTAQPKTMRATVEPRHQALPESQIAAASEQHPAFRMSGGWGAEWNEKTGSFK